MIRQVSEEKGIGWWEAKKLIHKCICSGKCESYKTRSKEVDFGRLSITIEQRKCVEETIGKVMKDVEMKEARAQIHEFICPGHSRSSK